MPELNPLKFYLLADESPERVYSPLARQYVAYLKQLPTDDNSLKGVDRFHHYLTAILGMDQKEADEEVAYLMNASFDATELEEK